MDITELRALSIFDGLDDAQLAELAARSVIERPDAGETLFVEGTPADSWWVLLDGRASLSRRVGNEESTMGTMATPGQWAGGFAAWDDERGNYLATARTEAPCRILRLPSAELRALSELWFPFGLHFINGLVKTVRNIEATARERESLVALGTLSAGLAHELNNPAAAATRAVDSLRQTSDQRLESLAAMAAADMTAEQFTAMNQLRRRITDVDGGLEGMALADREDELGDWLEERGVARGWELAPGLAAAGADVAWCEELAEAVHPGSLAAAVEWVVASVTMNLLLDEVKEATRRISTLVSAVKSYSQMDRASLQPCDLAEGIDSTLTILGHKLGTTVSVERRYAGDLPRVEARAGELNQVWTNLVDNAIDAMDGHGTLTVSAGPDPDAPGWVRVEFADTGSGMTPEVAAHAFEPFYTTKEVGKGTGLGLDISRRIVVERHSGEIGISSDERGTQVYVRLPERHSES